MTRLLPELYPEASTTCFLNNSGLVAHQFFLWEHGCRLFGVTVRFLVKITDRLPLVGPMWPRLNAVIEAEHLPGTLFIALFHANYLFCQSAPGPRPWIAFYRTAARCIKDIAAACPL